MRSTALACVAWTALAAASVFGLGGCVNILGDFKTGPGDAGGDTGVLKMGDSGPAGDGGRDSTTPGDTGVAKDTGEPTGDTFVPPTDSSPSDTSVPPTDAPADTPTDVPGSSLLSGSISGLATGASVVLSDGSGMVTVGANGSFSFPTALAAGTMYTVTVVTQPSAPSETCTVMNGTGTIGSSASQEGGGGAGLSVACTVNAFSVGGTVAGLTGSVTLEDNGGDDLVVTADGTFTFATMVPSGSAYAVTVSSQPMGQTCTVSAGTGTVGGGAVTDVSVTCTTNSYTIGGTVTGLAAGDGLTLQDNGGNDLMLSANGMFTFTTPVASGMTYAVTVSKEPSSPVQMCTVSSSTGTVMASNVTSVLVNCASSTYTVGGSVSGLAAGDTLPIENNGADEQFLTTNGMFTFMTPEASGMPYNVTVVSNPASPVSQDCEVTRGTGTVTNNVANVSITCTTNNFTVGGTITGVADGNPILIKNGTASTQVTANGNFTLPSQPSGTGYSITVGPPPNRGCTITNGTGTVGVANVTNVAINCSQPITELCGVSNPGGNWCGGNCSNNHAAYANYYCQLAGYDSAQSYTVLTTGDIPCIYYNGMTIALTQCSQVLYTSFYGLSTACDAISNLVCQ